MTPEQRQKMAKEWVEKNYGTPIWKEYEKAIALRAFLAGSYSAEEVAV